MRREAVAISPIAEIIADIRAGRIVVLVDDEDRENEGDLVFAAEFVSPDKINFLANPSPALVCIPTTEARARALRAAAHGPRSGTRAALTEARGAKDALVQRAPDPDINTAGGPFRLAACRALGPGSTHPGWGPGPPNRPPDTLVRVQEPL